MGSAIRSGIVDKVYFFYAPKISGGDDGFPICAGPGAVNMRDCIGISDIKVRRFGDDILVEGYLKPSLAAQGDLS